MTRRPSPVPPSVQDEVESVVAEIPADGDLRWKVRRLAESVYADGYTAGHMAGDREAYADRHGGRTS